MGANIGFFGLNAIREGNGMGNTMKVSTDSRGAQRQEGEASGRMLMRRRDVPVFLAAAAIGLACAGCGKKPVEVRLSPLPEDAVILVYAAGIGTEADFFRSTAMDEAMAKATKRKVVSRGQAGEFTENALKRLPDVLQEADPDLMVLGYGAMDLWKATDRAQLKANLGAMIDLARKQETQVVMLALPDLNKLRVKPDPIFEEVAQEKQVPIEAEVVQKVLKTPKERVFRYMVNDQGLETIAAGVRALCVKSGALTE